MADDPDKKYIFDNPSNIQRLVWGFYAVCLLLIAADFVIHRHTYMPLESIPAFYAIYGFAAYVVLVVLSVLLRKVVMRKENYYDE